MSEFENFQKLRDYISSGENEKAIDIVQDLLKHDFDVNVIMLESIIKVAEEIGKLYENGDFFLPDMLIAADAMKDIMELLKPKLKESQNLPSKGILLIGTAEGDIHDIGKSLIVSMLEGQGFDVIDLGVDVKPSVFVSKAKELKPKVIGLSGLLTMSISKMHETVNLLKKEQIPSKIILGGGILSKEACEMVGANEYAKDGWEGVKKIMNLMEEE